MLLGIHVSKQFILNDKNRELHNAIVEDTDLLGINSAQIFTHGPKFFIENKLNYDKVQQVTKNINLIVHSAYVTIAIWKVNNKNKNTPESLQKINNMKLQLLACKKIGAWALVLHVGKIHPSIIAETMHILKPYAIKTNVKILLEMVALKPDPDLSYETPEKLNNLISLIGPKENWYGICVDTAHIWAAGVDISTYEYMKSWLNGIAFKHKLMLFHLNGSSAKRGSGKDRHEIAFEKNDLIWKNVHPKKSGVHAIAEFAHNYYIPMICEVNRGKNNELYSSINKIKKILL
jgi:deoxyribonuclease-4